MRELACLACLVACTTSAPDAPPSPSAGDESPVDRDESSGPGEPAAPATASPQPSARSAADFEGMDDDALCAEALMQLGLEEWSECSRVSGGIQVPGGRADIVTGAYDEPTRGTTHASVLIIQHRQDPEITTAEELGTAYDVPGESTRYVVGPIELTNGTITVEVVADSELYGETGDPETSLAPVEDRQTRVFRCELDDDGLYSCEPEPL